MTDLCIVTQFLPLDSEPLPAPIVVASLTCDPRIIGNMKPTHLLQGLAVKLGLLQYEIVDCEPNMRPGTQLELFPAKR